MKLPNGYGSVIKLGGKRRKKWAVRKTIGYKVNPVTLKRTQKYKYIGYYTTRKEAMEALSKYNLNPVADQQDIKITFNDIYDNWTEEKFKDISKSKIAQYKAAYKYCSSIYDSTFAELKLKDLQSVVDSCERGYGTKMNIVTLLNQMYDYAMKNDVCEKKYSSFVKVKNDRVIKVNTFTNNEINKLWEASYRKDVQTVLMLIYSGVRIGELLNLKKENIDFEKQCFYVAKSKTDNGIRYVPIADKTLQFFKDFYISSKSEYLLTLNNKKMNHGTYVSKIWDKTMSILNTNYTPHTTRKTFVSLMAEANINQTIIKKIVGHSGAMSLTEKVYTRFDIKPLLDAVNRI